MQHFRINRTVGSFQSHLMERGHTINRGVSLFRRQLWAVNPRWKGKSWQIVITPTAYGDNHGLAFMIQHLYHAGCLQLRMCLLSCLVLRRGRNSGSLCHELKSYQRQCTYSQHFLLGSLTSSMLLLLDLSSVLGTLKYHGLAPLLTSITAKMRDSANPCSKAKRREIPLVPRLLFGPTAITVKLGW